MAQKILHTFFGGTDQLFFVIEETFILLLPLQHIQ